MTKEKAIKFANCLKNNYTIDFNDMADFCDTVIKALEIVEEFETAQIITGGRLNGRTYAYKRGLEDGKRKALEEINEEQARVIDSSEIDIQKFTEAMKHQPLQVVNHLSEQDCVSRKQALSAIRNLYPSTPFVRINLEKWHEENKKYFECEDIIKALPPVTPTQCIAEVKFSKEELREICNERIEIECTHGTCKDCANNKGVCLKFLKTVKDDFYCKDFEKRGNEDGSN